MIRTIIEFILLFIIMVALQAVVFNHLVLWGVAMPVVFIYWLVRLPVNTGTNLSLTLAFLLGLAIDICSDTQGMNALCCTIAAAIRLPILRLYFPREEDLTDPEPSIRSLGSGIFMKYLLTFTTVYCILYFMVEAFTFFNPLQLLLRILCSSIIAFMIILAIDSLTHSSHEKRL